MASSSLSSSSTLAIVITGASRGFGRAVSLVAAKSAFQAHNLNFVLVARSTTGLEETAKLVAAVNSNASENGRRISVSTHTMDLSDLNHLDANLDTLCSELQESQRIVLINNAGSIGYLGPAIDSPSLADLRSNVDFNVTSSLWVSVRLAKFARQHEKEATIVNISSLVAVADFATFGIYSAGKAARDKYHVLMAKETPSIRVLNYAPGPLETDMVEEIRSTEQLDPDLKQRFQKQVLSPEESARKLMHLLQSDEFQSGAHIDYYDLPEVPH